MIYVDDLFTMTPRTAQARRFGNQWCHLFTDSPDLEELHQFAEKLFPNVLPGALRKHVFQPHKTLPHYDLVPSRRALAVKLGAKEVSGEEMKAILMHEVDMRSKQGDEATLHARNIPYIPSRNLDSAYELTQAIEKAEAAKQPHEVPVFGDPLWIHRSRTKPV